jgi:hypothetical protein
MVLTLVNITGSSHAYLSSTVIVPANSSVTISDLTQQIYLSIDGQLKSDIGNAYIQISDSINTYAGGDAITYLQQLLASINPIFASEESIYARAGQMFNVATNQLSLSSIVETPIFLVVNATGSGKVLRLKSLSLDSPISAGDTVIYRVYGIPTSSITSNGTVLTPSGGRQTGQNSPIVNMYKLPTVSANGLFLGAKVVDFGGNVDVNYEFSQYVEPGFNVLVTAVLSQSNGTCGLFARYSEEDVI